MVLLGFAAPPSHHQQAANAKVQQRAAATARAEAERAARVAAHTAAAKSPGPHLTFAADRVAATAVAGGADGCGLLTVNCTGTCAVFYEWRRVGEVEDDQAFGTSDGPPGSQCDGGAGAESVPPANFFLVARRGVLLPGETRHFAFGFTASSPGVYTEDWALVTVPPLPSLDLHHRSGNPVLVRPGQAQPGLLVRSAAP